MFVSGVRSSKNTPSNHKNISLTTVLYEGEFQLTLGFPFVANFAKLFNWLRPWVWNLKISAGFTILTGQKLFFYKART
jgi:hypothetical protein